MVNDEMLVTDDERATGVQEMIFASYIGRS
jgi:hypothetical protein